MCVCVTKMPEWTGKADHMALEARALVLLGSAQVRSPRGSLLRREHGPVDFLVLICHLL